MDAGVVDAARRDGDRPLAEAAELEARHREAQHLSLHGEDHGGYIELDRRGGNVAAPSLTVRYSKLALNKLVEDALNVAFDASTLLGPVTFKSEDHQEALAALREKRLPSSRIAERRLPP